MRGPYYDELHVGQVFESGARTITEADVVLFTSLTRIVSPLFTDEEWARSHHFGGRIVPGPLTLCYAVGLTEELTNKSVLAALAFDDIRFFSPVRPGDTIHVVTRIEEMRPSESRPGTGIVTTLHEVVNQHGARAGQFKRTLLYGARAYFEKEEAQRVAAN